MRIGDAIAPAARVALVGLAKNTGKTVALGAILAELEARGETIGVTSIGRDGEATDAIDDAIAKPPIHLPPMALVATTDRLLERSAARTEVALPTDHRTPLGRVVIARLLERGTVEVAGPVAAQDVGDVVETMRRLGAERVLVDGSIDRRAGASPRLADGVVMSTGAVLSADLDQLVRRTRAAAELMTLPAVEDAALRARAAELRTSALLLEDGEAVPLETAIVHDRVEAIVPLLRGRADVQALVVRGALCEPLLEQVARARRGRATLAIADDATRVFLGRGTCARHRARGVVLAVLHAIPLLAVTTNPVAPLRHRFDAAELRERIARELPGVPVLDVLADAPVPA
ncbi:MAG: hypothetical protein JSS99_01455 [Actinobacteria bacterium]|nr:hypothetical protein [Actinomycetota bacterium]